MPDPWTPALSLRETPTGCRLCLDGLGYGEGRSLQEAADDLVARVVDVAAAFRAHGPVWPSALGPVDSDRMRFMWELAELAAAGQDIRSRIF